MKHRIEICNAAASGSVLGLSEKELSRIRASRDSDTKKSEANRKRLFQLRRAAANLRPGCAPGALDKKRVSPAPSATPPPRSLPQRSGVFFLAEDPSGRLAFVERSRKPLTDGVARETWARREGCQSMSRF